MPGLMIIAHAPLASSLKSVAEHTFPDCSRLLEALDVSPDTPIEAGVNVPMLWRSLCYATEPLEAVVMRAMAGATQGVMQVATSKPQNQTLKPGGNDQAKHHHQQ
jgi:PTS system ascorbate-specific IIA component